MTNEELEARIVAIEAGNAHRDERIVAAEAEIDELTQLVARNIVNRAAAVVAARTMPMSPEMSSTGRSEHPERFDSQEAMLRSRSGDRKSNVPGPVQYGVRPTR
jgi:hypothetical protein